ncbi:ATP-binding cassette domain-containing protein [Shinella sp. 838]|nr:MULTISPECIES: ATP-binding cassette domain-containing protein [unclassified Shinella]MCA0344417.1 ATP-binding cassette domain-containing protein [Pseudomonadota bacterium]MDG4673711.1 ATP-binding cassette domain-containing protein [Shinella sp. 838]
MRGAITGIAGESGSGKSTIGRIIAGLETARAHPGIDESILT